MIYGILVQTLDPYNVVAQITYSRIHSKRIVELRHAYSTANPKYGTSTTFSNIRCIELPRSEKILQILGTRHNETCPNVDLGPEEWRAVPAGLASPPSGGQIQYIRAESLQSV